MNTPHSGTEQVEKSATVQKKWTKCIDIYRTIHPPEVKYTFAGAHGPNVYQDRPYSGSINKTTHMKELKPYKTCSLTKTDYTRNQ